MSSLIPQCSVLYCTLSKGIFKSFGERIWLVSGLLSRPFLTRFLHTRCHIKEKGFGNKMYISDFFKVVGYLHMAGFKNRRGTYCAKCTCMLVTDIERRSQNSYTTLCNDVVSHGAPMGVFEFCLPRTRKQMQTKCARNLSALSFMYAFIFKLRLQ